MKNKEPGYIKNMGDEAKANYLQYANFRRNLSLLRASSTLSSIELSEQLSMPIKRISDLEIGRHSPKLTDIMKITTFFQVSTDDILHKKATVTF